MACAPSGRAALAAWPRFLLTQLGGGLLFGALITAGVVGLDTGGVRSLILSSDMPALATVTMALLCASLASCGMLATAMAQFESYPTPQDGEPVPARTSKNARRPPRD